MKLSRQFVSAGREYSTFQKHIPAPYMRRSFTVDKMPEKAEITITGQGFYELFFNGKKLTKGIMAPYISNPDDMIYYDRYDILPYLKEGKNTVGVILGNGMLNCPGGEIWDFEKADFRSAPKLAFAVEMEQNGEIRVIEADEKVLTHPSHVILDDIRIGQWEDHRLCIEGWNLPDFDDSAWKSAIRAETPRGESRICEAEAITARQEIKPQSITVSRVGNVAFRDTLPVIKPLEDETGEGYLYDFGVNTAGLARLKIKGEAGQKITLQFAEGLNEKGEPDLRGMSFLPERLNHRDMMILKGGEEEIFLPTFTYHGFRYVLVFGMKEEQATKDALTMVVYASDLCVTADLKTSDPIANSLFKAGIISDLANFYYFPTDCPHREKNGWTGDASLSAEQMTMLLTPDKSFHEWMRNIAAAQDKKGAIPGIVPTGGCGFEWGNGPAWDNVSVNIPYALWKLRGDTEIIKENTQVMVKYLDYISQKRDELGLIHIGLGDWCPTGRPNGKHLAPLEFTDTVLILDYARKASEMFKAVGLKAQAAFADMLSEELYCTCRRELVNLNTMEAYGATQTTQAMAIYYDVFTPAEKPEALRRLVEIIHEDGDSMDVGILGARVIFHVLAEGGYGDLAYNMIHKTEYPSYGNWIERGATSLWESFPYVGEEPSSLNHHFFGDFLNWDIRYVLGIQPNPFGDGPNSINIAPVFPEKLTFAEGYYTFPGGKVYVTWKRDGEEIVLSVTLPETVTGRITAVKGWQFKEGRKVLSAVPGEYRLIPAKARDAHRYY